jgi:glycosyltransferase involved in cell wall biosynthesis
LVATPRLQEELQSHGFAHLGLWPLGVDTDFFIRNPAPALPKYPSPVFGYLGRISPEKSTQDFLKLELPGSKIVIGDGPLKKELEEKYSATATFVGLQEGRALVDWLSLCDVLVHPSRTETFGLVIVEALACGVPVAAYNVMGPQDILTHGLDGYLSDDLKEAALACLTLDREKCRQKALAYSWSASADAFFKNLVPIS